MNIPCVIANYNDLSAAWFPELNVSACIQNLGLSDSSHKIGHTDFLLLHQKGRRRAFGIGHFPLQGKPRRCVLGPGPGCNWCQELRDGVTVGDWGRAHPHLTGVEISRPATKSNDSNGIYNNEREKKKSLLDVSISSFAFDLLLCYTTS